MVDGEFMDIFDGLQIDRVPVGARSEVGSGVGRT